MWHANQLSVTAFYGEFLRVTSFFARTTGVIISEVVVDYVFSKLGVYANPYKGRLLAFKNESSPN